jgi:hypothetical protein
MDQRFWIPGSASRPRNDAQDVNPVEPVNCGLALRSVTLIDRFG